MKRPSAKAIENFLLFIGVLFLLVALSIAAMRMLTPLFSKHPHKVNAYLSQLVGMPIRIQKISTTFHGIQPVFSLTNVSFYNPKNNHLVVRVHRAFIGISLWESLLRRRFQPGIFILSGLKLQISQQSNGKLIINGLSPKAKINKEKHARVNITDLLSWCFAQHEMAIQNLSIIWQGKRGEVIPFSHVTLRLNNSGDEHRILGSARLAQTTPTSLRFIIHANGSAENWKNLSGKIYLNAQHVLFAQWSTLWHHPLWKITSGTGRLSLWGGWDGLKINSLQTQLGLTQTALQWQHHHIFINNLKSIAYFNELNSQRWQALLKIPTVRINGKAWQPLNLKINKTINQWSLYLTHLNLTELKPFLVFFPKKHEKILKTLSALSPTGNIPWLLFNHVGSLTEKGHNLLGLSLNNFSMKPYKKIPGVTNVSGLIFTNNHQGVFYLDSHDFHLTLPKFLVNPVGAKLLTAHIAWQNKNNSWIIKAKNIHANIKTGSAEGAAALVFPGHGKIPHISVLAQFQHLPATLIPDYLPLVRYKQKLRDWFQGAFDKGEITMGTLLIRGPTKHLPYHNIKGVFQVTGLVHNVSLHYSPRWPDFNNLFGQVDVWGRHLIVNMVSGKIYGAKIHNVSADIPEMGRHIKEILTIEGDTTSDLARAQLFIEHSPLAHVFDTTFDYLKLSGPFKLHLQLHIPLHEKNKDLLPDKGITLLGAMQIKNATAIMPKWELHAKKLAGDLAFTELGIRAKSIKGLLFNKPLFISMDTINKKTNKKTTHHLDNIIQIKVMGQANNKNIYQALHLGILKLLVGESEFTANVNLQKYPKLNTLNITSNLMGMAVHAPKPFYKLKNTKQPIDVRVKFARKTQTKININYNKANINITHKASNWLVNILAKNILGTINIPIELKNKIITAKFKKIILNTGGTKLEGGKHYSTDPDDIPNMNIKINNFQYNKTDFGTVSLVLRKAAYGVALKQIKSQSPNMVILASGKWNYNNSKSFTNLFGEVKSGSVSKFLENWGLPPSIDGENAKLDFSLSWPGMPYSFKLKNISGEGDVKIGNGRIKKISSSAESKVGLGRILNLFSLRSLPRRLRLDFSDLTDKGFSFNSLNADVVIAKGNAYTKKSEINGNIAKINIHGRIGLIKKDYDLRLTITPYLTGSLPIIATIAGGPIAGAATWVANKLFLSEVNKINTYVYLMTGPWSKPNLIPLKNNRQ